MNDKHSRNEHANSSKKRRRNLITFDMKLDIVKRYENKERSCDIARTLNLSQSTVRTILIQSDKIKERSKRLSSLVGTKFLRPRSQTIENMEKRLAEWIKFETERNNPVSLGSIQEKARELYEDIRIELNDVEAKSFVASHGWLDRFKKRIKLSQMNSNEVIKPAAVSVANMDVVNKFPSFFKTIIDEGGYSPKQVFSVNEFGLFWRRLPTYNPSSQNESQLDNDRLALILGANALGDYKLKPVVIFHKSNPLALRGYSKDHLPVVWKHNPKAIITSSIFTDYFCNRLTNELKDYCLKENIPFKILLVLSCASHHPKCLEDFSENIKVLFLPPNTESYLLPMESDIIQFLNAHYFHLLFEKLIEEIQSNEGSSIEEQRRNINIKHAVDTIGQAWAKIHQKYLKCLWYRLWPEHAGEHKSFELIDGITKLKRQIISLAETINIELDVFKVSDALMPPKAELTLNELKRMTVDGDDENSDDDFAIRTLSSEDLCEAFRHVKAAIAIFDENDYNRERSFKVMRDLENAIEFYKQMYKEKMKNASRSSSVSFVKVEATEGNEEVEYDEPEIHSAQDDDSIGSEVEYEEDEYDPIG
ncbi:hypothetical protein Trydic_g18861 [Trypoxylus dichotomus]